MYILRPVLFIGLVGVFFLPQPGWSQPFQEISKSVGIDHYMYHPELIGGGAAFFDLDNDGWEDLYLTGGYDRDKLYRNLGNGQFQEIGAAAGLGFTERIVTQGVVTGDIDNDGDRDVFVTTDDSDANLLLLNDGNGNLTEAGRNAGIRDTLWTTSATMIDVNLDGWLDIYAVNYVGQISYLFDNTGSIVGFDHRCFSNSLYINDGTGNFTEAARVYFADDEGCGLATAATDYDQDGDMDLYIANDFGEWVEPNVMLQNQLPVAAFSNVGTSTSLNAGIYGMGIAIGDYDEDGQFDYYVTNLGRNVLYHNEGNGTFSDVTDTMGVANTLVDTLFATGWGTAFMDTDNDTHLDLFVANGQIPAVGFIATSYLDPNKLYRNIGSGSFQDISLISGMSDSTRGRGMAYSDYDHDGDLDILVAVVDASTNTSQHALLFRNDLDNGNNWIQVRLQGTMNNRDGFGAHVRCYAGGRMWIREIDGGSSHMSHHSSIAHVGLGAFNMLDSLSVTWPGGYSQVFTNVPVNQQILVTELDDSLQTLITHLPDTRPELPLSVQVFPNPFAKSTRIRSGVSYPTHVRLEIFDSQGRSVRLLQDQFLQQGELIKTWNGENDEGLVLSKGLYLCVLQTGNHQVTQKIWFNP